LAIFKNIADPKTPKWREIIVPNKDARFFSWYSILKREKDAKLTQNTPMGH
jgi:hypothetical protein